PQSHPPVVDVFLFNDPDTTRLHPLSLHDALPISSPSYWKSHAHCLAIAVISTSGFSHCASMSAWSRAVKKNMPSTRRTSRRSGRDRKSTRLNSSHVKSSYAVFCLKKKNHTAIANS